MQMRNVMPPMALIARRIPRHILEITYTIKLPVLPGDARDTAGNAMLSPQQLLESYCQARGLFRARALGESDMPRAARQILKDFTDGRLLFCHPPADLAPEVGNSYVCRGCCPKYLLEISVNDLSPVLFRGALVAAWAICARVR